MYSELMCALGNSGIGSSVVIGSSLIGTLVPESRAGEPLGTVGQRREGHQDASRSLL